MNAAHGVDARNEEAPRSRGRRRSSQRTTIVRAEGSVVLGLGLRGCPVVARRSDDGLRRSPTGGQPSPLDEIRPEEQPTLGLGWPAFGSSAGMNRHQPGADGGPRDATTRRSGGTRRRFHEPELVPAGVDPGERAERERQHRVGVAQVDIAEDRDPRGGGPLVHDPPEDFGPIAGVAQGTIDDEAADPRVSNATIPEVV